MKFYDLKINRKFHVATEIGSTFYHSYQAAEKVKYDFLSPV
jgi:hypothetical protein